MDGSDDREFWLIRKLKEQDGLERPIIVITNHNSIKIERKLAEIGVFYHLIDLFEQNDMDDLIEAALRSWNKKSLVPKPLAQKGAGG